MSTDTDPVFGHLLPIVLELYTCYIAKLRSSPALLLRFRFRASLAHYCTTSPQLNCTYKS